MIEGGWGGMGGWCDRGVFSLGWMVGGGLVEGYG